MMPILKPLVLGLALSVLGTWSLGCGGKNNSPEELPFQPAGPEAAPDPMQPGPFPVGVRTYY